MLRFSVFFFVLQFDNMNDIYMCPESNDTPIDIDIPSNFEELVSHKIRIYMYKVENHS